MPASAFASSTVECPNRNQLRHQIFARWTHISHYGNILPNTDKIIQTQFNPAVCAIASKCSTPLVEPPKAISTLIEFSNAALVANIAWFLGLSAANSSPLHLLLTVDPLVIRNRFLCRGARQTHAQGFNRRSHRVCSVHTTT